MRETLERGSSVVGGGRSRNQVNSVLYRVLDWMPRTARDSMLSRSCERLRLLELDQGRKAS
jgi:hypothetical protein